MTNNLFFVLEKQQLVIIMCTLLFSVHSQEKHSVQTICPSNIFHDTNLSQKGGY